jgi:hypothetical protein
MTKVKNKLQKTNKIEFNYVKKDSIFLYVEQKDGIPIKNK